MGVRGQLERIAAWFGAHQSHTWAHHPMMASSLVSPGGAAMTSATVVRATPGGRANRGHCLRSRASRTCARCTSIPLQRFSTAR